MASASSIDLAGIFPPISTPFDAMGEVSTAALTANLERWNAYDLAGYVVLGSNGEAAYLSDDERLRVLEAARRAIPPGKLMIAGTGCEATRATIRLTQQAARLGADAAIVLTPGYYQPEMTGEVLVRHFCAVADASPIPVLLYNVPKFTGVDMDAATVARASEHPNIVGIKDSSGNVAKLAETVQLARPGFQVLVGTASVLFPGLAVGAVGGVVALSLVAPQQAIDIWRLHRAGRWEEAAALQRRMLPVNAAVTTRFGVPGLKAALDMLGYYGGPVRPPLIELDEGKRQALRAILTGAGLLPGM
jgi:4-hydroxy-2-oxoglutarate aldolase